MRTDVRNEILEFMNYKTFIKLKLLKYPNSRFPKSAKLHYKTAKLSMAEIGRNRSYPVLAGRGVKSFQDESIYNLVKPEIFKRKKPRKHISKYPGRLSPSYSTFGIHTTSNPAVRYHQPHVERS